MTGLSFILEDVEEDDSLKEGVSSRADWGDEDRLESKSRETVDCELKEIDDVDLEEE